jgi:hypothetical protein
MTLDDGQITAQALHELTILARKYNETFEDVFGTPYWEVKRFPLVDMEDDVAKQFMGILRFLSHEGLVPDVYLVHWTGYIKFALHSFQGKGIIPSPSNLKSRILVRQYLSLPRQATEDCDYHDVDYRKVLSPELRSPEYLRLLGLI